MPVHQDELCVPRSSATRRHPGVPVSRAEPGRAGSHRSAHGKHPCRRASQPARERATPTLELAEPQSDPHLGCATLIPSVFHPGPTAPGFHSLCHCGPASFPGQSGPLVAQPVRRKPQKLSRRRAAASLPPGCSLLGPRRNAPGPCPDRRAASCDTVFTVTVDRQSLPDRRFTTTDCQFQEVACVLIHQRRLENLCFLHADVEPSPALAGRDGPGNGLGDHRGRPAPAAHARRRRPRPLRQTQRPPRSRRPGPLHRLGRGPLAPGLFALALRFR